MSNPADNTEGCEVCGLDRQVLGCRPGKCKNDEAPPIGYTKCPTPGCPRWMAPNRLKCWFETLGGDSGAIYPDWEPPAPAAPGYPLPWRWEKDSYEPAEGCWGSMVDARGEKLIGPTNLDGILSVADEYVRAVTERAGAMEQRLRRLERRGMKVVDGRAYLCCPECSTDVSYDDGEPVQHLKGCELGALLAEIDAAKASG